MSWGCGWDSNWYRDIGYGVPAHCDQPECGSEIDRGLGYVCGGEPYGGEKGCGLYFCDSHRYFSPADDDPEMCARCCDGETPHEPTPDHPRWIAHKLADQSWAAWRDENPEQVTTLRQTLSALTTEETP